MVEIIAYIILFLGLINVIRMSLFFIIGDIYDIKVLNKKKDIDFNPLISIVIAAYNEELSIGKCLESIVASTYKNYEILVVNDGSKDSTSLVINNFKKNNGLKNLFLI